MELMKRMLALAALAAASTLQAPVAAAVTIDFLPSAQTVALGDPASVDVVISGLDVLGEIVGSYDLDATYDASVLTATDVTFHTALGGPLDSFPGFDLATPGVVDFFEVSFLSDADLAAIQGDSFTLATLVFDAIAVGTSPLGLIATGTFNFVVGSGAMELTVDTGTGAITVEDAGSVPEPTTGALLAAALSVLVVRGRARQRAPRR